MLLGPTCQKRPEDGDLIEDDEGDVVEDVRRRELVKQRMEDVDRTDHTDDSVTNRRHGVSLPEERVVRVAEHLDDVAGRVVADEGVPHHVHKEPPAVFVPNIRFGGVRRQRQQREAQRVVRSGVRGGVRRSYHGRC